MKKIFVLAVFAALLAVSCQKNENQATEQKPAGVPMKLIASIGEATKVSYEPDGNVLKTNWEASETISVLTLDGTGHLLTVDNFTSTGAAGRAKAEFSGTFTGGATPAKVVVIYPALIYDGVKYYHTAKYTDYTGAPFSSLYNAEIGNEYIQFKKQPLKQTSDNDASHLVNYCVMDGVANTADIKNNILNVTLSNEMTILKVTASFPAALKGKTLESMEISGYDSSDAVKGWVRTASWEYVDLPGNDGIIARGGGYTQSLKLYSNIVIPDSGVVTLYFVNHQFGDLTTGDKLKFTATVESTDYGPATKTVTGNISFDKGKIYRMSVTIPE
jgi:hypothetical protein